jgi:hypothetical protein
MAIEVLEIPIVPGGGAFRQAAILENDEYIFDMHYNQRDPGWYCTIENNSVVFLRETKLVAGYNLLDSAIDAEKLSGALYVYDKDLQTPLGYDPGLNDLGNNIILVYEAA